MKKIFRAAIASACMLGATGVNAGPADDTLYAAFQNQLPTLDRYYSGGREGYLMGLLASDALVYRNPETLEFEPLLATKWTQVDELTYDFDLREGVKFHNGDDFTAADVVYTMKFLTDPQSKIFNPDVVSWVASTEELSPHKVRIKTKSPVPLLLSYLIQLPILPAKYHAEKGKDGYGMAPVGTGPYKISRSGGNTITLERNDNYFTGGPKSVPAIRNLVYKIIPDVNTQIAELIAGRIDWAYYIPQEQASRLAQMPQLKVTNAETFRIAFLTLDAAGTSDPNSPLKDIRVREAINYAIDAPAIAGSLIGPSSTPLRSACLPSQFGCETDVKQFGYDPAKAKELLAQAGYPDGFDIDIYAYRSRPVADAILGYLRAVGIRGNLKWMQYSAVVKARRDGQTPIVIDDHGSSGINDVGYLMHFFFGDSRDDQYKDKEVIDLIKAASTTTDQDFRKTAFGTVLRRIAEQAYWKPLFTMPVNYVENARVNVPVPRDENVEFWRSTWVK